METVLGAGSNQNWEYRFQGELRGNYQPGGWLYIVRKDSLRTGEFVRHGCQTFSTILPNCELDSR